MVGLLIAYEFRVVHGGKPVNVGVTMPGFYCPADSYTETSIRFSSGSRK